MVDDDLRGILEEIPMVHQPASHGYNHLMVASNGFNGLLTTGLSENTTDNGYNQLINK